MTTRSLESRPSAIGTAPGPSPARYEPGGAYPFSCLDCAQSRHIQWIRISCGLRLLGRDSGSYQTDGLGVAGEAAGPCAESGANQLLFIIDTCFSGEAVSAGEVAARQVQQLAPAGKHVWVGVLTSCLPMETARDGLFGERLVKLLRSGPDLLSCGCGGLRTVFSSAAMTCVMRC